MLILLIAGLGALLCGRVLVRPIQDLSQAARRLADLDMTWSCPLGRADELGDLARSLHTMSRRLSAAMTSLEEANQVLQEDMARLTLLSQQRRDFFAAASPRIEDPLTILKGQVESMVWGIGQYKNPQAILPETLREVEHMEKLVKEILDISKLEMEGYPDTMESLSLPALISRVGEDLLPFAKAKDMTLHWNLAEPVTVTGNASLLEKAVHNLLSNAIRHAPSGASVWVTLSPQFLRVENSGVRIPEEDLPFLFTPFYRVEKSRNKATGGSGLGLYLVHAIATMHGFSCQIQNTDRGVAATLWFSPRLTRCRASQTKINLHHMKSKPSSVRMFPFSGKDGFFYVFFHRALLYVVRKRVRSLLLLLICLGGGDPGPVWLCHTGGHADGPAQRPPGFGRGVHPTAKTPVTQTSG